MLGIYLHAPFVSFRKNYTRDYFNTYKIPPPSTCYGFLLSLVGEFDIHEYSGALISPTIIGHPQASRILRKHYKAKNPPEPLSKYSFLYTPGIREVVTQFECIIWVLSIQLEEEVRKVFNPQIESPQRSYPLCIGESDGIINWLDLAYDDQQKINDIDKFTKNKFTKTFVVDREVAGQQLTSWVDFNEFDSRYVNGDLLSTGTPPRSSQLVKIAPGE